ncbi:hypothetical protein ROE7235_00363 [Roseibaca ekhonensis]|uniref:VWFA domain-containing protein n=1 Tax=Roseinatronobacter ekhonensis TaxID=254356 RepID=A0A3B0MHN1_9RHOB|nr:TadE/TadG family type IV pilus assembly protein [Roseibaca ekhonensis]SUZ30637.1 hypothetical protein ROE7235_00363 [Roseibaca ekhonensis]
MNTTTSSEGPPRKLFAQVMSGFARAEDGAVLVFGLIIFVLMLMVSGLAVDVMRYENDRVRLQGTSDRAVLAATSLMNSNVTMTPQELAQAYFDAEGLGEFASGNITVTDTSETGRTVRVNPTARMETMFLRMSGINNLDMTAPAAAVEGRGGTTKVEIVMVLDASGSMGSSTSTGRTRLAEMKLAAKSFAAEILGNNDPANVSLSLVTYDSWVLPTPGMLNHMLDVSGSGACLEFDDWTDVRDGNGPVGVGNGNGPPWASVGQNSSNAPGTRVNCSTNAAYEIKPMVNDLADFESYVDAISTRGTTSIDLGARFGAMLLDPDMRGFIDSMVDSGQLPAEMRGRPFDWDEPGVHRVMVLLTDGQNCCGSRFNSSVQDDNTLAVCQGMRANDVTVYTVSFDAPQGAIDLLSECASSENHFFNTGGDALVASFDSIATHVKTQTLRLTE